MIDSEFGVGSDNPNIAKSVTLTVDAPKVWGAQDIIRLGKTKVEQLPGSVSSVLFALEVSPEFRAAASKKAAFEVILMHAASEADAYKLGKGLPVTERQRMANVLNVYKSEYFGGAFGII